MPTILPVSDLQRNFKAVSETIEKSGEPVYLTRNGYPAMVIMDAEAYEEERSLKDLIFEREERIRERALRAHEQALAGQTTSLEEARRLRGEL